MSTFQPSTGGIEGGSLISLSLHKFSYATSPNLQSKLLWTHLPERDNLFVVFDHLTTQSQESLASASRVLKIVRGGDIIEHIFLEHLVLQSRLDDQQSSSQPLSDSVRRVVILIKRPLIAIRYQLPDGQIRRIQMNFSPEAGYDVALGRLMDIGLPIRSKSSSQGHQSQIQQAGIGQLPVIFPRSNIGGPINSLHATAGLTTPSLPLQSPNIAGGYNVHTIDRPYTSVQTGRFSNLEREIERPYTDPGYKPYNALHEPSRDPRFAPLEALDPVRRSLFHPTMDEEIPSTVSTTPQTISQMLPPKRELPFTRLAPKLSKTEDHDVIAEEAGATASVDNVSMVSLDQFTPKPTETIAPQSKSTAKPRRPRTAISKKQPVAAGSEQTTSRIASSDDNGISKAAKPSDTATTETTSVQKSAPRRASVPKTTKRAAPAKKAAVKVRSFATQTPPVAQKPTRSCGTQTSMLSLKAPTILPTEGEDWAAAIHTFVEKYKHYEPQEPHGHRITRSTKDAITSAKDYLAQDAEKRKAELEAVLCSLVMEDGFETLMEEVEATCKRTGLKL